MTTVINPQRLMLVIGALSCLACGMFSQYLYNHDLGISHNGNRAACLHRHVNTARL
jgi:hypothetical protein